MRSLLNLKNKGLNILLVVGVILLLTACSYSARRTVPPLQIAAFQLDGSSVSASDALATVEAYDMLALTPEMIRYFDLYVARSMSSQQRARMIHTVLRSPAFLGIEYQASQTLTAEQVFSSATANCIGFANAYIALARHYGLDARYQLLDKYPQWTSQGEMVAMGIHINSVVQMRNAGKLVVDIDRRGSEQVSSSKPIPDKVATALFYNNLAMDYFTDGDSLKAYSLLVKALQLAPEKDTLWSNLGVIYRHNQQLLAAETTYHYALHLNPDAYTTITNLTVLYQRTNQQQKFAEYFQKMTQLKQTNPYYYFYLAQQAQHDNHFNDAIKHITKAIALKDDEPQFIDLQNQLFRQSRQVASSDSVP